MSDQPQAQDKAAMDMLKMMADDIKDIEDPLKRDERIGELIVQLDKYNRAGLSDVSEQIQKLADALGKKIGEIHLEIFGNGNLENSLIYKMAILEAAQKARIKKDEEDQDLKKVVRNTVIVIIIGAMFSLILVNTGG